MTDCPKLRSLRCLYIGLLFLGILFPRNAYAYLDPGSSSFFIQILIAALTAIPLAFGGWFKKIFAALKKTFRKKPKKE